jgi:hypothetical protein
MSELAAILEREGRTVDLEPGHHERLLRRRDRRRRNRRLGSAFLAIAITAAMIGYAVEALHSRTERVPLDRISSKNVAHLGLAWIASAQASTGTLGSPSVRDGVVYVDVGAAEGSSGIMGFPLACAGSNGPCLPTWSGNTSHTLTGIVSDERNLYVGEGLTRSTIPSASPDHYRVEVFPRTCSTAPCRPIWASRTVRDEVDPLAFIDGLLYVRRGAALQAYRPSCDEAICDPVWTARDVGPPTIVDSRAVVRTRSGVAMFPAACWTAQGPACSEVGRATVAATANPAALPPPLVVDGRLILNDDAGIEAFAVDCHGSCRPVWRATVPGGPGFEPVETNSMLFTAADGGSDLYAFDIACQDPRPDRTCAPAWIGHTDQGVGFPPIVAGDRVIVSSALGSSLEAYPLSCTGECAPAWTAPLDDSILFPPVASDDVVISSGLRGVTAFGSECADPCSPLFRWDLPAASPQMSPLVERDSVIMVGGNALYALRLGSSGQAMTRTEDRDRALPLGFAVIGLGSVAAIAAINRRRMRLA